jgi:hypothetical protein
MIKKILSIKIMFHQDLNILVAIYLMIYGTESSLPETNFMLMQRHHLSSYSSTLENLNSV